MDSPVDDSLYVANLDPFVAPEPVREPEMENPVPAPRPVAPLDGPVTYTVVPATTSRGKVKQCLMYRLQLQIS